MKCLLQQIIVGLGGRVAEEIVFEDVTTGASQDIKQSTALARAMVTQYGFSEKIGLIDYYLDEWHANNYPKFFEDASNGAITIGCA